MLLIILLILIMVKNMKVGNSFKLINIFLFYSIFGNLFERCVMYFIDRTYVSGFMGTIFTPIYGIAMLMVLFLHNKIKIENKFIKIISEFFIYMLILTTLEFSGGILIENVFNKIFWNYDNFKYNFGKYISLETSLLWGTLSMVILYFIHPLFKRLEHKIPKVITILLSVVFVINLVVVMVK